MLKHELQLTLFWDISANFSFCRLAKGREYSAYEESDCFAGTADDIGTNHSKPRLNSGDNNFFPDKLSVTKGLSSKTRIP